MSLEIVLNLRELGGPCGKPNIYDDAADRILELEKIWDEDYPARIDKLEATLRLVNDRHGPILEASVHDLVLACLGLKVHPNGTGYGYTSETPDAMHARIVTETADAMASQMETKADYDCQHPPAQLKTDGEGRDQVTVCLACGYVWNPPL
jgi:hypothetical protein